MNEPRFPILGPVIPPMLGRAKIMQQLWNGLTKKTPSHLSIVGPRYSGKSVLLKALAERMSRTDSPYSSVILLDLGHQTPRSDDEFLKLLCRRLGEGIRNTNAVYGAHLLSVDSGECSEISEVLDALYSDGDKVLMLWDGFDKPLSSGTLTRNLWDNLLDLCRKPGFRLVTSTRKELHQLIRDEKSNTSDFWGVFEGVVRISVFDDANVDAIIAILPDFEFLPGARTELVNWSGGFPPLFLEILNQIFEFIPSGQIDNKLVIKAASRAREKLSGMISTLWDDCPAGAKDLYIQLVDHGELLEKDVRKIERDCLIEKGFARQSGNKLIASCLMLQEHIRDTAKDTGSMARLFGTWENYESNIRSLLERRLAHISNCDNLLHRWVSGAIQDIPDSPDDCLNSLTGIFDRAFDLIWQREFGEAKTIPQDIVEYWYSVNQNDRTVQRLKDQAGNIANIDRGSNCRILQFLTGSERLCIPKAKYVTKDTYVLINSILGFRNRNQHPDGQAMHVGVAISAVMICLELLACLERELAS